MSKTMTVILSLLALFLILGMLAKNKKQGPENNSTQDELLNKMSNGELLDLYSRVVPNEIKMTEPTLTREKLISRIKEFTQNA